jgi:hypothetical protein
VEDPDGVRGGQEDDGLVDDRERLRRKKMRLRLRRKPRTKTRLRSNSRKPERGAGEEGEKWIVGCLAAVRLSVVVAGRRLRTSGTVFIR